MNLLEAKRARAKQREEKLYGPLRNYAKDTATADYVRAALRAKAAREDGDAGTAIGTTTPALAAIQAARAALGQFHLSTPAKLQFTGTHRVSGRGAHGIDEGVLTVEATLRSISGAQHAIDIPMIVHGGRILEPVVFVHQGRTRALTQNAIDDVIGRGEFTAEVGARKNMYSPPDERAVPRRVPLVRPGIYNQAPLTQQVLRAALTGVINKEAQDYLDVAERPRPDVTNGDAVRFTRDLDVKDRGGGTWHIGEGSHGVVAYDVEGDGSRYAVQCEDLQKKVIVPGDAIERV